MVNIVVYDLMVHAHIIAGMANKVPNDDWIKAAWAIVLNRGPDMLPQAPFLPIVVNDCRHDKKYWRTLELPEYKGNRVYTTEKSAILGKVLSAARNYVAAAGWTLYEEPYFEADDWAGAICRYKRQAPEGSPLQQATLYLSTIDSDWCQLIDDTYRIKFACCMPYEPRLRDEAMAIEYFAGKGIFIDHPAKLAYAKAVQGDKSDNVPPGSSFSLLDLVGEHPEWKLSTSPLWAGLTAELDMPTDRRRLDHMKNAVEWVMANGFPLPCSL